MTQEAAMARPSSFSAIYKSVGDQDIDADVYLPNLGSAPAPALINIHGGAFMLGSSKMVNMDQVRDCLSRGWVVIVPNHRLCPQVNLLEGPMADCRDVLSWIYDGGLETVIQVKTGSTVPIDHDHVFAFGTSSGGTLALSLGYGVPKPVAGIYDMYGPCQFSDPFWSKRIDRIADRLPSTLTEDFLLRVYDETPVPISGGVSLEGQASGPPDFSDPRQAFAFTQIAHGQVIHAIFPSKNWDEVDPILNVTASFPPTFIVHGLDDTMVPFSLSKSLLEKLEANGVRCGMREIPGEEHTFAARMTTDSETWRLQREGFDFLEQLTQS